MPCCRALCALVLHRNAVRRRAEILLFRSLAVPSALPVKCNNHLSYRVRPVSLGRTLRSAVNHHAARAVQAISATPLDSPHRSVVDHAMPAFGAVRTLSIQRETHAVQPQSTVHLAQSARCRSVRDTIPPFQPIRRISV